MKATEGVSPVANFKHRNCACVCHPSGRLMHQVLKKVLAQSSRLAHSNRAEKTLVPTDDHQMGFRTKRRISDALLADCFITACVERVWFLPCPVPNAASPFQAKGTLLSWLANEAVLIISAVAAGKHSLSAIMKRSAPGTLSGAANDQGTSQSIYRMKNGLLAKVRVRGLVYMMLITLQG